MEITQTKNMINQVVWIWQYQEPETNKCRKSRRQKWNPNNLGFLVLPKTHLPVSNRAFHLFIILVKHLLLSIYLHTYIYIFYKRTWLIKLFEFGSTKSQRQINTANYDVRNEIKQSRLSCPAKNPSPCFQPRILSFLHLG